MKLTLNFFQLYALAAATLLALASAQKDCTFLAIVVDESRSMSTEQDFLRLDAMPAVIEDLKINFNQQVFVCSFGFTRATRVVGCSEGLNESDYNYNTAGGGYEDGYQAIEFADDYVRGLTGSAIGSAVVPNNCEYFMVLVTDEDRDVSEFTYNTTVATLQANDWYLHAILNQNLLPDEGIGAKQEDASTWKVFLPVEDSGTGSGYDEVDATEDHLGTRYGTTEEDYVRLAYQTDGSIWNLNKLRLGGFIGEAFTKAFVQELAKEIVEAQPPAPSPAPPPAAAPVPDDCFSGRTTVFVQGQGETRMDALKIGDAVKVANGSYSKVYSFGHKEESVKASFLQIRTEAMNKAHPLEITQKHFIYVFDESTKLVSAQDIKVGDFLVSAAGLPARVESILTVKGNYGLYTPITVSGDILVNGVQTSSYTSIDCLEPFVSKQFVHWLSHGAMALYRLHCTVVKGGCHDETYNDRNGSNPWTSFLSDLQQTLLNSSSVVVKATIVLICLVPFIFIFMLGKMMTTWAALTLVATEHKLSIIGLSLIVGLLLRCCRHQVKVSLTLSKKKFV